LSHGPRRRQPPVLYVPEQPPKRKKGWGKEIVKWGDGESGRAGERCAVRQVIGFALRISGICLAFRYSHVTHPQSVSESESQPESESVTESESAQGKQIPDHMIGTAMGTARRGEREGR